MRTMEEQILANISDPGRLEKLYRTNRNTFTQAFRTVSSKMPENPVIQFWNERLNYKGDDVSWGSKKDLLLVVFLGLLAGVIAKIPVIFGIKDDFFFPRNIGFIVFPVLYIYFAVKNRLSAGKLIFLGVSVLVSLFFINSLPDSGKSDTLVLSCIHLLLVLWSLAAFSFTGDLNNSYDKRLSFLKYNGDLAVIVAVVAISGGLLTAMTMGLFSLIGVDIEKFYTENILVFGISATPIACTYLTQNNPHLVGKVSPLIARIFSPLVLVMLVIYLAAMVYSGKDPYNDREFLLIFNVLLVGVMALIFFSVAERSGNTNRMETIVLFLLSSVTILVNAVALSAIIFRIAEWGITPNRAAVLGSNFLMLVNLVMVAMKLYRSVRTRTGVTEVGYTIAAYLPVYSVWAAIVTFVFPIVFGGN